MNIIRGPGVGEERRYNYSANTSWKYKREIPNPRKRKGVSDGETMLFII